MADAARVRELETALERIIFEAWPSSNLSSHNNIQALVAIDKIAREALSNGWTDAAEKPNVEQAIREWLEDPASLEPGAIFSLSRDRSQLLVDQIAADRLHTAEQVAANWQRLFNVRTESIARTVIELLNGIPGASESIARGREQLARGEGEAQALAAANEVKLARLREDFQQLARLARRQSEGNAFAVQAAWYAKARLDRMGSTC